MGAALVKNTFKNGFEKMQPSKYNSLFEITTKTIQGKPFNFSDWKGRKKAFVLVNFSTKSGLSKHKFKDLNELYKKYENKGLEIAGFPCISFTDAQLEHQTVIQRQAKNKFQVQFPLFEKVDVNGPMTHPVYHFLRTKSVFYKTQTSEARLVPWTFSIFILNREGKVDSVYPPLAKKEEIEEDVKKLLL